jgi:hypothetical protein
LAGEGSGLGVIGPQWTVPPTNEASAVALSAVVPPENVASSKVVPSPEKARLGHLGRSGDAKHGAVDVESAGELILLDAALARYALVELASTRQG